MKIAISELRAVCLKILKKRGLNTDQALLIFNEYLDAELSGKSHHGFHSFPEYAVKKIERFRPPKILREEENLLFIDGAKNLGQIVCHKFVPKLIAKAKKRNIAMMGIVNMHSYQMPGTYARLAAENNLVAFIFNYGGAPRIAPFGSIDPVFGSNPIAIGVPGKDFPVVVDMATAKRAMMVVRKALKLGKRLLPGLAIDKKGKPTTDPAAAIEGALLPFGGYKGSALALVTEILTKTMFGINPQDKTKANRGYLFIFFNPAAFTKIGLFKSRVSSLARHIKQSRKAMGVKEIFLPGERAEGLRRKNKNRTYINLDPAILGEIRSLL